MEHTNETSSIDLEGVIINFNESNEVVKLLFKKSDLIRLQYLAKTNDLYDYKELIMFLVNQYLDNPIKLDVNKIKKYFKY